MAQDVTLAQQGLKLFSKLLFLKNYALNIQKNLPYILLERQQYCSISQWAELRSFGK